MSKVVVVLLDESVVSAVSRPPDATLVQYKGESVWDRGTAVATVASVRDAFGEPSSIVLVIGLSLLEIARPELPPLTAEARRALLLRDADRYFPTAAPLAVSWANDFAFAVPSALLETWVAAFSSIGTVDAIVTLPQLCARHGLDGAFGIPAGGGARGAIVLRDGALTDVRRMATPALSVAAESTSAESSFADATPAIMADRPLPLTDVLRSATTGSVALDDQLLDERMVVDARVRRQGRLLRSVVLLALAVLALGWVAARRQTRELDATRALASRLISEAAPARAATVRLELVRAEQRALLMADSLARGGASAAAVLARVGALLPKDAFVQRLEWDGVLWRLDGSASDAPGIVPLLDADPHFADVRVVAASTRFMDVGRQRESFSIAFRTREVRGGVRGAQ